ncbi:MAG: hypothetical protein U1G07_03820 [Verrucomicrobiota bacterium]
MEALAIAAAGLRNGEFANDEVSSLGTVASALNAQYSPGQWTIQSITLSYRLRRTTARHL